MSGIDNSCRIHGIREFLWVGLLGGISLDHSLVTACSSESVALRRAFFREYHRASALADGPDAFVFRGLCCSFSGTPRLSPASIGNSRSVIRDASGSRDRKGKFNSVLTLAFDDILD